MIEGSGSVTLTSGSGSRRPKNIWIRRIRIRNASLTIESSQKRPVLNTPPVHLSCSDWGEPESLYWAIDGHLVFRAKEASPYCLQVDRKLKRQSQKRVIFVLLWSWSLLPVPFMWADGWGIFGWHSVVINLAVKFLVRFLWHLQHLLTVVWTRNDLNRIRIMLSSFQVIPDHNPTLKQHDLPVQF